MGVNIRLGGKMKIKSPVVLSLAAVLSGCSGNQAQLDKFASDIRELREIQAQQTASMEEIRTEVRKLGGKLEETQYAATNKTR